MMAAVAAKYMQRQQKTAKCTCGFCAHPALAWVISCGISLIARSLPLPSPSLSLTHSVTYSLILSLA